jgi:antirestriction protein ArdC
MTTKTETRTDKLRAAHDKLQEAVAEIASGDDWKRMLKVASKFHNYSFNNQLLIFLQRPDATRVAGFRKWQELNRFVRKGEKGIQIFAPCKYKTKTEDANGDEKSLNEIRGFRVVHVFDISQTDGEPLEDPVRPQLLDGDAPEGIWDALVAQASDAGFDVVRDRRGSANGYCDFLEKKIAVRPDVSPAQAVKTLVHELAHALLHSEDRPKTPAIAEVEVESVAYIVCDALGLDSGDYSLPYVTRWAEGSAELVKQMAQRVTECARGILGKLEAVSP